MHHRWKKLHVVLLTSMNPATAPHMLIFFFLAVQVQFSNLIMECFTWFDHEGRKELPDIDTPGHGPSGSSVWGIKPLSDRVYSLGLPCCSAFSWYSAFNQSSIIPLASSLHSSSSPPISLSAEGEEFHTPSPVFSWWWPRWGTTAEL